MTFSVTNLQLSGKDGEDLSANKVYLVRKEVDSVDLMIVDDKKETIIGFDLFIPCAYLKVKGKGMYNNRYKVVYLPDFRR